MVKFLGLVKFNCAIAQVLLVYINCYIVPSNRNYMYWANVSYNSRTHTGKPITFAPISLSIYR